jgi:hypothetical protein
MYNLNGTPTYGAFNIGAEDKYFLMRSNASCCSTTSEFDIILSRMIGVESRIEGGE